MSKIKKFLNFINLSSILSSIIVEIIIYIATIGVGFSINILANKTINTKNFNIFQEPYFYVLVVLGLIVIIYTVFKKIISNENKKKIKAIEQENYSLKKEKENFLKKNPQYELEQAIIKHQILIQEELAKKYIEKIKNMDIKDIPDLYIINDINDLMKKKSYAFSASMKTPLINKKKDDLI